MSEPDALQNVQATLQMLNHCVGIAIEELQSLRNRAELAIGQIAEGRYDAEFREAIDDITVIGELQRIDWTSSIKQIQDCAGSLQQRLHDAKVPGFGAPLINHL